MKDDIPLDLASTWPAFASKSALTDEADCQLDRILARIMAQRRDRFRYLPLTARTKAWGLYVTGCGHVMIPPHGEHPPQGHPHLYEFSWDRGRMLPEYQTIFLADGAGVLETKLTGESDRNLLEQTDLPLKQIAGTHHRSIDGQENPRNRIVRRLSGKMMAELETTIRERT
jgi:hypothetical protein